jgi:glutamine---fructose-6-phosphate transaminase (isomerizing)
MCGIVGYIGTQLASNILISGLKRLEYRGYDSAGISLLENGNLITLKKLGKVSELEKIIDHSVYTSTIGIAHTRWATHGEPSDINAHPHSDASGRISLIHNGIIENYVAIKKSLLKKGYSFKSETDSEVLAVFIGSIFEKVNNLEEAVRLALNDVVGTFGIVVISSYEPDKMIAARRGSPLLLGIGNNEYIVASDATAIIAHTRQVIYLSDNEMAIMTKEGFITKTIQNVRLIIRFMRLNLTLSRLLRGVSLILC